MEIWLKIKNVVIAPNNWVWILLSMILGYLGEVFRGMRWVLLIKPLGYNVKVLDCINSVASGYMFNAGVPRSGEIARCTLLNKTTKTPISYLFGHVLMERLIDFIILEITLTFLISSEGKKLETEELIWDEKSNKIYTDKKVIITTDKEMIEGEGFQSSPDFLQYSISNIQGTFNFEHRTD